MFDASLFEYDVGYREFYPGTWLPRKKPDQPTGWHPEAAPEVDFHESDILFATYPKTGVGDLHFFYQKVSLSLSQPRRCHLFR